MSDAPVRPVRVSNTCLSAVTFVSVRSSRRGRFGAYQMDQVTGRSRPDLEAGGGEAAPDGSASSCAGVRRPVLGRGPAAWLGAPDQLDVPMTFATGSVLVPAIKRLGHVCAIQLDGHAHSLREHQQKASQAGWVLPMGGADQPRSVRPVWPPHQASTDGVSCIPDAPNPPISVHVSQAKQRMRPRPANKQSRSDRQRRMLPGVDRVVSFFQSAGVTAELTRDGCLKVNGGQTRPRPTQVLPPAGTFDWGTRPSTRWPCASPATNSSTR